MKNIKKLLAMVIMVSAFLMLYAMPVAANEGRDGVFTYEIWGDEATIKYCDVSAKGVITIPESIKGKTVTSIARNAFWNCDLVTSVIIPKTVTSMGTDVFRNCDLLTNITIPGNVESISEGAFKECPVLKSVTISQGVKSIDEWAFYQCNSLKNITIPNSVTRIGAWAFSSNDGITSITIPKSVTTIGDLAFSYCGALTSIDVEADNPNYTSADGVLFDKAKTLLIQYPKGNTRTKYDIPKGVTIIKDSAFNMCDSLISITIPESVTTIGGTAFGRCDSLKSITIPKSVTGIGAYAFDRCKGLTSVTIAKDVTGIGGEAAFFSCGNLKSITIPDSVTKIGKDVFMRCPKVVIYGNSGSTAESYAKSNKILFKSTSFSDIPKGIWYEECVMDLVSKGIIDGKENNMYDPEGKIKRCEFAKILATASGENLDQYKGKTSFADVPADEWYTQCVEWAFKHKIVKGKGEGFAPGENISRQEMAVMIKRYAVYKKVTLPKTIAAFTFNDDAQIADWAKEEVSAMQQAEIIGGKPGNIFDPSGSATRAEAAKMVSKFLRF
ncbi:MAG: leucine-rich repeat protein [Clostridiales bacterium]